MFKALTEFCTPHKTH